MTTAAAAQGNQDVGAKTQIDQVDYCRLFGDWFQEFARNRVIQGQSRFCLALFGVVVV